MDTRLKEGTFKKCDLHIHSSSCYSRQFDHDAFLEKISSVDLDVIAITDHNILDVDLLFEVQDAIKDMPKKIIAGVELNLALKPETIEENSLYVPDGKAGKYFHALVWCSPENARCLSDKIDQLFIRAHQEVKEVYDREELSPRERSQATKGRSIFLEDLQSEIADIPHFLVPHEHKGERKRKNNALNLSGYLPDKDASGIECKANISYKENLFYYNHAMAVEGGKKSRLHITDHMAKQHSATISSLYFSDPKRLEEIGQNYTWIDFDGDLDSLVLAISDPESRIRTSDDVADLPQKNTGSYLEKVTFEVIDGQGRKHAQEVIFSPGYNGIVGSRGSGKSMLARVLDKRGLRDYSSYIDADSIRYHCRNSAPSSDKPKCLYLGQGALEDIYSKGDYSCIPFLKERITPEKEKAESHIAEKKRELGTTLELQHSLLSAFVSKYPEGVVHFDHLLKEKPSGVTISCLTEMPGSNSAILESLRQSLSDIANSLNDINQTFPSIDQTQVFPENAPLFDFIEKEVLQIENDLTALVDRVNNLNKATGEVDEKWFILRDSLIKRYGQALRTFNQKGNSSMLDNYTKQTENALTYLRDLLELRIAILDLENMARETYKEMTTPVSPIKFKVGNGSQPRDEIKIELASDASSNIDGSKNDLLSNEGRLEPQPLVKCCLNAKEIKVVQSLFNGRIFKRSNLSTVEECFEVYFSKIKDSIVRGGELNQCIYLNGKKLEDMSPGMKAEALLKLFLHDQITTEGYVYVILDQPEDNLDVGTISSFLIPRIKNLKQSIQFFIVSHSAPVIVNGDARTVVTCVNDENTPNKGNEGIIYRSGSMNNEEIKRVIVSVLDGGERYIKMRINKYNFQIGERNA